MNEKPRRAWVSTVAVVSEHSESDLDKNRDTLSGAVEEHEQSVRRDRDAEQATASTSRSPVPAVDAAPAHVTLALV